MRQTFLRAYRETLPEHARTLFDRFHFVDFVIKAVGVGSVGTMCGVGLFMAADNDPLFLQAKEAGVSARAVCGEVGPRAARVLSPTGAIRARSARGAGPCREAERGIASKGDTAAGRVRLLAEMRERDPRRRARDLHQPFERVGDVLDQENSAGDR